MQTKGGCLAQSGGEIEAIQAHQDKAWLTFRIVCTFIDWSIPWIPSPGLQIAHQGHLASLGVGTYGGTFDERCIGTL